MMNDLRYAFRTLVKNPGFAATAVATLALGIGANSAIFSVVSALMLKPLPYQNPERLAMVWEDNTAKGFPQDTPAPGNFASWRSENQVFEDMAAMRTESYNLTGSGEPEKIEGLMISASLFPMLGVQPAMGRTFLPEEDKPGARNVVVLSHSLWQRRFASDPRIVAKSVAMNGISYTVLGVMPRGFRLPVLENDLWTPIAMNADQLNNRRGHYLFVLARLKRDVTIEQAQAEMKGIAQRLEREFPATNTNIGAVVVPLQEQVVGDVRRAVVVLLAAVGFVLLIACANVASLLLARSASRRKEMALRTALGANRARVIRQLLTENLLLAVIGGGAGLLLASWGISALVQLAPQDIKPFTPPAIDGGVLAFTLAVSLACGIIFGLAPAFSAAKLQLHEALKEGGRTSAAQGRSRMRNALVTVEIALALVLLIGSGLLMKSFFRLMSVNPGFRPENLLTMRLVLPNSKYPELQQKATFYNDALARIQRLPGVQSAAVISWLPLAFPGGSSGFTVEGKPVLAGQEPIAVMRIISPDYFRSMSIPLRRGRYFDAHDTESAPGVAIINDTMARQFWPGEDPVGKRYKYGPVASRNPWITVVGISGDVRQFQLDKAPRAETYRSYTQTADFFSPRDFVIRASGDPANLARAVRNEIWAVDRELPISDVQTMEELMAHTVTQPRFNMMLITIFGSLAMVLAAVGIYGLLSYSVAQRSQEIGIRMALGARPAEVLGLIVRQALTLIGPGILIGLAGAFVLTRAMRGMLFEITPADPMTFALVPLLLAIVALTATIIPARRAARVDPIIALRYE